jgi:hypothetical protein
MAELRDLCKDNVICCDDNCQRCANLIYNKYMEQKAEIELMRGYIHRNNLEYDLLSYKKETSTDDQ